MASETIDRATAHFAKLVEEQLARVERMKQAEPPLDFGAIRPIKVGICFGDGIGPIISKQTMRVLEGLLADEIAHGRVELRTIEGLTIENRVAHLKAIPDDVLSELKACHVILKAPTTTPEKGGPYPNIESANVAMRRALDLYANVRPVKVPKDGIDWVIFRENTEGAYILGSQGIAVTDELAFDFTAVTRQGCERIIRMAFEYAQANGVDRVTVVTKANVIKTTDGLFLDVADRIAKEYPGITWDAWYIDIMTAKLIDPKRRTQFRVMVMPNLYGDILSDEAAEFQGGVGTAGSANIGSRYAMFEAIHGSAPRMIDEGRGEFADPASLMRAGSMMLRHMGLAEKAERLDLALDVCTLLEKRVKITGRASGATAAAFTDYVLATLADPELPARHAALLG
ncbi:MAG: isocitrate/isopropylmalate dehydrogenase family protein [Thermoanaerobaculaceae bacterium]|nr:isocitrate/isopropylmalate dehydrogenase family protein [Thermoanaerobaculaceae bacterium]MDI9622261.1 isocitrate/isopropylmalate family dehydrogenase [Acidobacteriota bacterium]NLH11879.1 isocitrate/isopropylmalate dehydrogenase family protein [Holophagae bacterium]HPW56312.1 isocitrate/isopropylmalate family dehydrogenase [Thermoanaerobaculaceae bacterium]